MILREGMWRFAGRSKCRCKIGADGKRNEDMSDEGCAKRDVRREMCRMRGEGCAIRKDV